MEVTDLDLTKAVLDIHRKHKHKYDTWHHWHWMRVIGPLCPGHEAYRLTQLWRVASSDTHPKTLFVNFDTVAERDGFRQLAKRLGWTDERLGLELLRNFMKIHDEPPVRF